MADRFFSFLWSKGASNNKPNVHEPLLPPSSAQEAETRVHSSKYISDIPVAQTPSPPPTAPLSSSPSMRSQLTPTDSEPASVKLLAGGKKPKKRKANAVPECPPSPFKLPPSPSSTKMSIGIPADNNGQTQDFEAGMEQSLSTLLQSVPAKTLHTYLSSRLGKLPPSELISLSNILSELEPPPLRHCVRCHKDFTDVENNDRSCLIGHDDNSAVVQYASRSRNNGSMKGHETFWGCCGNTVEGEGELGPPSGWCYEGMHTLDRRRARWRDDSTLQDDKLHSCEGAGCIKVHSSSPRKTRERGTKRLRESTENSEDEMSITAVSHQPAKRKSISPSAISIRSTRSARRRAVSPAFSMYSARRRSPSLTPSIEMSYAPSTVSVKDAPKKKRSELMKARSVASDRDLKMTSSSKSKRLAKHKLSKDPIPNDGTRADPEMDSGVAIKTAKAKKRRVS